MHHVNYVTARKLEELTGYTLSAIHGKKSSGVWREGELWHRAPDGRVLYDIEGYHRWVEKTPPIRASTWPEKAA